MWNAEVVTMARNHERSLRCPSCQHSVVASKLIFREGFRCPECGSVLQVPAAYPRALVLASIVIGLLLVWVAGVRDMVRFCLFLIPTAFAVLTVLVRLAPLVLPPVLVARQPGHVTTLGLGENEDNRRDA
jgi:uncharacterized C2H2 Zn-finger protein